MATRTGVTFEEAMQQVAQFVAGGDDEGALAYGREVIVPMIGSLTAEQIGIMSAWFSSIERAVSYAEYERQLMAQRETA